MPDPHPNLALLQKLDLLNLDGCADLFLETFVWHYVNAYLPEIEGDYVGVTGLQAFFNALSKRTGGTFKVTPLSVAAFGDEFVVTHVRDVLTLDGQSISLDAIVVWRVIDDKLAEAWDIPATQAVTVLPGTAGASP